MEIRKCSVEEATTVGTFYDEIVKFMDDNGVNYPKWIYKVFPTTDYAVDAARAGNQFVCVDGEKILSAFVLSENPEGDYSKGAWSKNLAVGEYLVLHALAVAPDCQHCGLGKKNYRILHKLRRRKKLSRPSIGHCDRKFPREKTLRGLRF